MNEEKRKVSVRIVWKNAPSGGAVGILNGVLRKIGICAGEEIVCRCRIEVVNTGGTPCYSRIKTSYFVPNAFFRETFEFDPETGFLKSTSGNARVATLIDGVSEPDAFSPFQFRTTNTFRS